MKKKLLALVIVIALAVSLCIGLTACGDSGRTVDLKAIAKENIKIGLICLHDESSTYDLNFINAMNDAKTALGLADSQVIIKKNVKESEECYNAAVDLVEEGCNIIFADSFGHEDYIMQAAWEFPNVRFCHATGVKAHTANYGNYYNAFASIYEGRYLAGVAAGMKLAAMKAATPSVASKIGYVGAFTYAEVMSGYTSFYLGVKSIVPDVTMDVRFTGSWYDPTAEQEAAAALIQDGAVLISQHADSMGAPTECERQGVPNVSYNGSTVADCPNTFIVSSRIDWSPYYQYVVNQTIAGNAIAVDWTGTLQTGSVKLTAVNDNAAAAGTQAKLDQVRAALIAGTTKVFDTANFKKSNATITSYLADVNYDDAFTPDTEAIENGAFAESKHRSAPYFDIQIDGITLKNTKF